MSRIEQLLREKIGLDSGSIGSSSIQRVIRLRMKALGITQPDEYVKLTRNSCAEWTELVEAVVVTETWFFRDREPFSAFVRLVHEQWVARHGLGALRVLSVPCSSGEEPYSLVMALLDAGVSPEEFQIDAADISARALNKARRAIYGRNSFRGKDLAFRDRHFHQTKEGYVLSPAVRNAVRFFEGNVLSPAFFSGKAAYDIIFCRNLLIYFDRETQARTLNALNRLLSPGGFLVVGAAEQPLTLENGFVSANIPMAFACRKAAANSPPPSEGPHAARFLKLPPLPGPSPDSRLKADLAESKRIFRLHQSGNETAIDTATVAASSESSEYTLPPDLSHARRLADEGKLREAAALCHAHLHIDAASAQAWYLLGLVHDATGDPLALECYRKALYLNPNHYETLLQMALLSEKSGDTARARTFRQRAARIKPNPDLNSDVKPL